MNPLYKEFVILLILTFGIVANATLFLPQLAARIMSITCTAILVIGCSAIIYHETVATK